MDAPNQPSDTEMSEAAAAPPPHQQPITGIENIPATLSHGGRFIQYNIFGNIFEVTAKYKPPIMPIGKGAYGIVCSALNSETNEHVAIKKIANAFDNKIDAKRTLREIKLLRHMDHENVVAIRDIIPPPDRMSFNDVYIAYELMDTDLHQIIRSNQSLSEEHCQYFLYQILRGLKYIHSANVLHRDLKPSNLLLNANCDLKICDFGLARVTSETDFMTEYVVTRWYRAPELLLNSSDYTAAIDVWSVGCIFMELMDRPVHNHHYRIFLLIANRAMVTTSGSRSNAVAASTGGGAFTTIAERVTLERDVKKSKFIAIAGHIPDERSAQSFLSEVQDPRATHNCWAYKVGNQYRSNDDGEPSGTAGKPIHSAIENSGLDRVMVVVIRHFGGIKLGTGGLVRAYGGVATECLKNAPTRLVKSEVPMGVEVTFDLLGVVYHQLQLFKAVDIKQDYDTGKDGITMVSFKISFDQAEALEEALKTNCSRDLVFYKH